VTGLLQEGTNGGPARMLLANAGPPPPILVRDGAATMLGRPDTLAGAFDDGVWGTSAIELHRGDTLLLYTDGVLDTVGEGERFGEQRLLDSVRAAPADPAALLDHLDAALDTFQRGPQRDDTATVAVRYEGSSPGTT
jgi:serine phosphatase RsbU (regulator of sigma subunit)